MINRKMILGIACGFLAILLVTVVAACSGKNGGGNNDITGTWVGVSKGKTITVEITNTRWSLSLSDSDYADAGTYTRDGNTGIMQSTVYNYEVGTTVPINRNAINFTLNQRTVVPGTHALTRLYVEGDFEAMPINDGKVLEITKYTGSGGEARIPSRIQRLPVTGIGKEVFSEKNLSGINVPNGIPFLGARKNPWVVNGELNIDRNSQFGQELLFEILE